MTITTPLPTESTPSTSDRSTHHSTGSLTERAAAIGPRLAQHAARHDQDGTFVSEAYDALRELVQIPRVIAQATSSWAQYTILVEHADRDALAAALADEGIPTAVYYAKPLHLQGAYRHYPVAGNGLPVAEQAARRW